MENTYNYESELLFFKKVSTFEGKVNYSQNFKTGLLIKINIMDEIICEQNPGKKEILTACQNHRGRAERFLESGVYGQVREIRREGREQ